MAEPHFVQALIYSMWKDHLETGVEKNYSARFHFITSELRHNGSDSSYGGVIELFLSIHVFQSYKSHY